MDDAVRRVRGKAITRRAAVSAAALAASAAALAGCSKSEENDLKETDARPTFSSVDQALKEGQGTWVPVPCWHDCGGRCKNWALMLDGAVVRQKSDDSHEDSLDYPQMRGCVRGRAQRKQVLGADRLRYPLKRKSWQPGGGENAHGELRGKDEWERITWDEAFNLMAQEIKRVVADLGPEAIVTYKKDSASLNAMGGCTKIFDTRSFGPFYQNLQNFGVPAAYIQSGNDRYDLPNADYVILYSSNNAWSAPGFPAWLERNAKERGVKFVSVGPDRNATAQMLDADWVPVRCGTDTAFLLAVAYEMLRLDAEEGEIVDWDFLGAYCVGFDQDHMPDDAQTSECFRDYLEGAYDETPKTATWASRICGASEDDIVGFARIMGKGNDVMFGFGLAAGRCAGAEYLPQLMMCVCAMGGHLGKSGNCISLWEHPQAGNFGAKLVRNGTSAMPKSANPVQHYIPAPQAWDIIANGGGTYTKVHPSYGFGTMTPGQEMPIGPVKGIMHIVGNNLQNMVDMNRGIKAHRAVDFVFTRSHFFSADAQYSDIVLPLTTRWEEDGCIIWDSFEEEANRETLFCFDRVIDPLYECKSDQQIEEGLLEALGFDPAEYFPKSERQQFFEQLCSCTVMNEEHEYEPLVTVTQHDIEAWGYDAQPQEGRVSIDELIANGGYQVRRQEGDAFGDIGLKDFVDDPEAHPLPSKSGKLEFYCQANADILNSWAQDDCEFKPYPVYDPPETGYEACFENNDIGGAKGPYPYVMYTMHYLRRSHGVLDNVPWLREAWTAPVLISRADAEDKGIATGDTVLISSKAGKVLRKATILDTLMPGVVSLPHGSWPRLDETTGIDHGGADNFLTYNGRARGVFSTYNNTNVNIEKYEGEPLPDDVDAEPQAALLDQEGA